MTDRVSCDLWLKGGATVDVFNNTHFAQTTAEGPGRAQRNLQHIQKASFSAHKFGVPES